MEAGLIIIYIPKYIYFELLYSDVSFLNFNLGHDILNYFTIFSCRNINTFANPNLLEKQTKLPKFIQIIRVNLIPNTHITKQFLSASSNIMLAGT